MKELDNAVKAELTRIVQKFVSIRSELEAADKQVQALFEKSRKLEEDRVQLLADEEKLFEMIRRAYGPGKLNLANLKWVTES